jgi:hypothetical protein
MGEVFALSALCCFMFWDVYLFGAGVRPLDFVGITLLAVGLCSIDVRRSSLLHVGRGSVAVCVVSCAAAIAGVIADPNNVRAGIGVCLGAAVFMLFSAWPLSRVAVLRVLAALLVLNLAAFWLQFAVHLKTGAVLNYYAILGLQPRIQSWFFRGAGLYLEPADFALTVVSLLGLRTYILGRFDTLFAVSVVSVVCSLSLWGAVAAVVLVLLCMLRKPLLLVPATCVGGALVYFVLSTNWHDIRFLERVAHVAADPSLQARYGGLLQPSAAPLWSPSFWFGQGVRLEYMELGLNSLSYLVTSVGVVGAAALVITIATRAKRGWRVYVGCLLLLALTATYTWTYMYWWSWLALMCRADLVTGWPAGLHDGQILASRDVGTAGTVSTPSRVA